VAGVLDGWEGTQAVYIALLCCVIARNGWILGLELEDAGDA
jgi:hypothetical protein